MEVKRERLSEIKKLAGIHRRLNRGESVFEPQNWCECYADDVTLLLREIKRLRKIQSSIPSRPGKQKRSGV